VLSAEINNNFIQLRLADLSIPFIIHVYVHNFGRSIEKDHNERIEIFNAYVVILFIVS